MYRLLKHCAAWGAATAWWVGVMTESVATCLRTVVCSYPQSIAHDLTMLVFFVLMTWLAVHKVKRFPR